MRVLLVDDQEPFREGVAFLLKSILHGIVVTEAADAEQASARLKQRRNFDLALIDLNLPGASGFELIAWLRDACLLVPAVALSSSDDPATIVTAVEAGAMGFIGKRASAAAFADAIRHVMAKGIYLPHEFILRSDQHEGHTDESTGRVSPDALGLSPGQSEVLYRVLQGQCVTSIAQELSMPSGSVKAHTTAALRALNVTTRTQAIIEAARLRLCFAPRPS